MFFCLAEKKSDAAPPSKERKQHADETKNKKKQDREKNSLVLLVLAAVQRLERRRVERHHHDLRVVAVHLEHLGGLLGQRELEAALGLGDLEEQLRAVLLDVGAGLGQGAA